MERKGSTMSRTEPVTLTNMCMIKNKDKILVLDRNDPVWPGLTFPGGHVEKHESFHDSVIREVKEETKLALRSRSQNLQVLSNFTIKKITVI